jgi:hypothetical protein
VDPDKVGPETYAALVDLRAEIEALTFNVNKILALLVLGKPEGQRAAAIDKIESDLVNHKIVDASDAPEFRQYLVHLSMLVEAKAKRQAAILRELTSTIENVEAQGR